MQFEHPKSSHLGKFINIKDSSDKNIEIQTPQLKVYKITGKEIVVEIDQSLREWFSNFIEISSCHFKKYLPRNKQSPSFEGDVKYLTIKIKENTEFFHKLKDPVSENDKIYIYNLSKINENDQVVLLIETLGIWVNRNYYGATWTAKQILVV